MAFLETWNKYDDDDDDDANSPNALMIVVVIVNTGGSQVGRSVSRGLVDSPPMSDAATSAAHVRLAFAPDRRDARRSMRSRMRIDDILLRDQFCRRSPDRCRAAKQTNTTAEHGAAAATDQ